MIRTSRFKKWTLRGIHIAAAFVVVFLAARLLSTAAETETGISFLGQQWEKATLGWFVDTDAATAKLPTEQADFWLIESERVLAEAADKDPARRALLAMGAALLLNHPVERYVSSSETTYDQYMPLHPGSRSEFPLVYDRAKQRAAFDDKLPRRA